MNNKWIKTCKALKQLFQILSCSKCDKSLHDPQQFLHCGHFSCISCINNENTSCVQCQLSCENGNIIKDDAINQIIRACCSIATEIGFRHDSENLNIKHENAGFDNQSDDSKPSISDNTLTLTESKPLSNLSNKGKTRRKRKSNKNLNNNEDIKKAKYNNCSTALRIPKNINKTNHHGETKLHELCKKGNIEHIRALLDAGANPNVADYAKWTPLQETVSYNYVEVSKLLLEKGADVNQAGFEDRTPLHEAAENNNVEMVKLLLKYKAKKESFDKNKQRPVDCCKSEEIRELLNCDEDIVIVYEKKRNNDDNNINNLKCEVDQTSDNTKPFENDKDVNFKTNGSQIVSPVLKGQTIKISNIISEINSQESIDIVNSSSMNENVNRNFIEASQDCINQDSEEIDIMN